MEMTLGEKIRKARKRKMTQAELAEAVGVHETTIRRWESGERSPDVGTLQKISKVLDVPLGELVDNTSKIDPVDVFFDRLAEEKGKTYTPSMAYWGGVIDSAKNVAKFGNISDKVNVSQMLKLALASLDMATPQGAMA